MQIKDYITQPGFNPTNHRLKNDIACILESVGHLTQTSNYGLLIHDRLHKEICTAFYYSEEDSSDIPDQLRNILTQEVEPKKTITLENIQRSMPGQTTNVACLPVSSENRYYGEIYCACDTQCFDIEILEQQLSPICKLTTSILEQAEVKNQNTNTTKRSVLLANISHEIRTPISGLLGMLNMLNETRLDTEQKELADAALNCGNSLLTLVNNILDVSKIESGKLQTESIPFDIRQSIDEVIEIVSTKAIEKGIELSSLIHANIPAFIKGDPTRLRQILTNLLNNAIKFTDMGEITLTAKQVESVENNIQLAFEVTDTGIGIAKESLDRIFHEYEQADNTTTRHYGGTGLGLSICKQLCELMGGTISVESTPGKGSTFRFTIKAEPASAHEDYQDTLKDHQYQALIAIQNKSSTTSLEELLKHLGIKYETANTGASALMKIRNSEFDILIFDMELPDMSGLDLARQANHLNAGLKMILLTLFGNRGDARLAREAGVHAYLTRPVRSQQLRQCIQIVMDKTDNTSGELITRHSLEETSIRKKRVLLAEDDNFNQKIALNLLRKLDLITDVVSNGQDAIAAVKQNRYDLILMDIQMPVISGLEAAGKIRLLEQDIHKEPVPIIALTAHSTPEENDDYKLSGFTDFLCKPFDYEQLREKVLTVFSPSNTEASLPAVSSKQEQSLNIETFNRLKHTLGNQFDSTLKTFMDESPVRVTEIRRGFLQNDHELVKRAAHTLRSSCKYLGAEKLAHYCEKLETAEESELPAPYIDRIEILFSELNNDLKKVISPTNQSFNAAANQDQFLKSRTPPEQL